MHFPEEEGLVWMVQSISKGLETSRVAATPVSVGHTLFCHCQRQILWGQGNSASWNGHTVRSSWLPQITGAILHCLQMSNHINPFNPWEKSFLKAHIWWCNFLREHHCALICGYRKEKLLTVCFGHFYLSVAMDEWKELISPCCSLLEKNKNVDKRLSWLKYSLTPGSEPVFNQLFGWLEE